MKKDIDFSPIKGVTITIAKTEEGWNVFLLNRSELKLETILITSKGYGEKNGEQQKTSLLRHSIPYLEPSMHAKVENIQPEVFHLNNEYWVSYYVDGKIFDKKFIFLPDSIVEENFVQIPELRALGVLHD
ncbi:MAG: hypothetical protein RIF46_10905 [Cyclobacteriaceae bacterium]